MINIKNNQVEIPFSYYLNLYKKVDPVKAGKRCDIEYNRLTKQFKVNLMGQDYYVNFPEFSVEIKDENPKHTILQTSSYAQLLIIRYLIAGKAMPSAGKFCSYRDFPWGEVYYRQFYDRCIRRTARTFEKNPDAIKNIMNKINAKKLKEADYSCEFEFMKGLNIKFLYWKADEEFPSSAQILFSDNFQYAFSAEDLAVIGDITIGMLNK